MKKQNKQNGITLVALVITIIVLLILAGISINMLAGKDGILNRAKEAKEKNEIATDIETIKMEYFDFLIGISPKTATIDTFLEYLENEKGYIVDYVEENVELNGRLYTVKLEGDELIVNYFGQATVNSANLPKITNLKTIVDKNGISISFDLDKEEGTTIKYVITKEDGTIVKEVNSDSELNEEFNNLELNTTYIINVQATNQYGTRTRKATIKTLSLAEITEGKANFKITPNTQWQKEVIATIESSYENQTATLQYRIDSNGEWKDYTTSGFKVDKNTTIFGRFYNKTTQEVGYAFTDKVTIIDDGDPSGSIELSKTKVGLNSASVATVTLTDSQSGIDFKKSKYIINSSATALGIDESKYTGGSITKSPQTVDIKSGTTGKYYLHVLAIDKVGKAVELISNAVTVEDIIEIYTREDLESIVDDLSGNYALMNDIDLGNKNWEPIHRFAGTFDGRGHIIKNMTIDSSRNAGLFGYCPNKHYIRNVKLENVKITNAIEYAAGLVAQPYGGIYSNICVTGEISVTQAAASNAYVGSIIAKIDYSDAKLENCYARTDLYSIQGGSGGLVADQYLRGSNKIIKDCYWSGTLTSSRVNYGPIIFFGYEYTDENTSVTINNCYYNTDTYSYKTKSDPSKGLTTKGFGNKENFSGWDFTNTWTIKDGYPELQMFVR